MQCHGRRPGGRLGVGEEQVTVLGEAKFCTIDNPECEACQ
jgi:hypothetical protein